MAINVLEEVVDTLLLLRLDDLILIPSGHPCGQHVQTCVSSSNEWYDKVVASCPLDLLPTYVS